MTLKMQRVPMKVSKKYNIKRRTRDRAFDQLTQEVMLRLNEIIKDVLLLFRTRQLHQVNGEAKEIRLAEKADH